MGKKLFAASLLSFLSVSASIAETPPVEAMARAGAWFTGLENLGVKLKQTLIASKQEDPVAGVGSYSAYELYYSRSGNYRVEWKYFSASHKKALKHFVQTYDGENRFYWDVVAQTMIANPAPADQDPIVDSAMRSAFFGLQFLKPNRTLPSVHKEGFGMVPDSRFKAMFFRDLFDGPAWRDAADKASKYAVAGESNGMRIEGVVDEMDAENGPFKLEYSFTNPAASVASKLVVRDNADRVKESFQVEEWQTIRKIGASDQPTEILYPKTFLYTFREDQADEEKWRFEVALEPNSDRLNAQEFYSQDPMNGTWLFDEGSKVWITLPK